jgi:hypothetical protein
MYAIAPPDGIEQYEAELQMLHTFIAMMMFMSLALSSMLSMMRRQGLTEAGGGDGGGRGGGTFSLTSSRRGLSRDVIDSLPLKRYTAERNDNTDRLENDSECCPICLVDFSDGIEIRTLPCGHYYHWECVDSWLCDRTTCPTCRENIDNTEEEEEEEAMTNTTTTIASNVFLTQHQLFPSWLFVGGFEYGGRRRNRWRGVPSSAVDTEISLRPDNDETSNDYQEESTRRQRLPDISGFFDVRGHGRDAVSTVDEIGREAIELV